MTEGIGSVASVATSTIDKAQRLIKAATGEDYGDGYTVTDLCVGYAEPGYYGDDHTVIVFGNWNPKRFPHDGDQPLTKAENMGPRLFDALEHIGVRCEWLDEWTPCSECHRAMRTQADSYSWTMFGAFAEDGYVCADCMNRYPESYLDDYLNDPSTAITWCKSDTLTELGFEQWLPSDPKCYESGWHPGQTDNPTTVLAEIAEQHPDADVVFLIDEASQFYVGWSAWVRQ